MNRIPVIMDGDPGADDSLGIFLALHNEKLNVLGITSVCGNTTSRQTALNATRLLALLKREEIPVYCGANQPMKRELKFTTRYCGSDGLCDTGLEMKESLIAEMSAKDYLVKTLKETKTPVTIIVTAGFTNLAEALTEDPSIKEGIREVIAASGYFGLNQKVSRAEWNIKVDPEAAAVVYDSGITVKSIGLDVTCMLENAYTEQVLSWGTGAKTEFLRGCDAYNRSIGVNSYALLIDGMAVAAAICPEIAKYEKGRVVMHPEKTGAELMEFIVGEGNVYAAYEFDMETYLNMIKEMVTK